MPTPSHEAPCDPGLDEVIWQAWKAMALPEGYRAEIPDEEGLGVDATRVPLVAEIVSPGKEAHRRDHIRKQRWYAQAGIEVYLVIDDFEDGGTVTVFSSPDPAKGTYGSKTRVGYGTPVTVPDGPAKGLTITGELTAP
ncbi:Uma2 family endonuclease [Streptomyces sp. NPDC098789]|uniref:Uma2 family endonuclease n=1 Tax=Streptomyces sp. NPDC098789 TaxID=3366098 RepID=UPI00380D7CBE